MTSMKYRFSELLNLSDRELENNASCFVYLEEEDLVRENFDFLIRLVNKCGYSAITSNNYILLKEIDDILKEKRDLKLILLDDFENRDRNYIDICSFEKTKLLIPLPYVLWGDFSSDLYTTDILEKSRHFSYNSNEDYLFKPTITVEELKIIREEIFRLIEKCKDLDAVEKIIIVSDYLQNRVQFIGNIETKAIDGTYITDGGEIRKQAKEFRLSESIGNIYNVLFKCFGVCRGIADTTTILLNNPEMNVNVRVINGLGHAWNVVKLDKNYYIDNTWCITRNKDRYFESLKAKSFSGEYLLFGTLLAERVGSHLPDSFCPNIEIDDYDRDLLRQKVKKIEPIGIFTSYNKPPYDSYKLK